MKSPKLIIGIAVIAVLIIGTIAIVATSNKSDQYSSEPLTSAVHETTNPESQSSTATPSPTNSGTKAYSMADISTHNSQADCYTTIGGKVYNLTSWISKHPGGSRAILSICGKDGTAAFTSQHGGQARPERELASFYIGDLK